MCVCASCLRCPGCNPRCRKQHMLERTLRWHMRASKCVCVCVHVVWFALVLAGKLLESTIQNITITRGRCFHRALKNLFHMFSRARAHKDQTLFVARARRLCCYICLYVHTTTEDKSKAHYRICCLAIVERCCVLDNKVVLGCSAFVYGISRECDFLFQRWMVGICCLRSIENINCRASCIYLNFIVSFKSLKNLI